MTGGIGLADLKDRPLWVGWQTELRPKAKKPTKVPYSALGRKALANKPESWRTRRQAEAVSSKLPRPYGEGGIGLEFAPLGDGWSTAGVDLDTCRSPDGSLEPWALEVMRRLDTYVEISPSQTGAKAFFVYRTDSLPDLQAAMVDAELGKAWKRGGGEHPPAIELYLGARFFTVTGQHVEGTPAKMMPVATDTLLWLIREAGPAFAAHGKPGAHGKANGADGSRSALAMSKGAAVRRRGGTYAEMVAALAYDTATAAWTEEKGHADGARELRRIWEKAGGIDPAGGAAWMAELSRGARGPHATIANAMIVMGCDPVVVGIVAHDAFAHRIVLTRSPPPAHGAAIALPGPYPRTITDTDIALIQSYIQRAYDMRISQAVAEQAVVAAAEANHVHPVRDWLNGLVWDGKPRVDDWLQLAFGTPKDAYHRAVGTKFLCAAVRRIRSPGCKFDYVLVLEGDQGRGKSLVCAALFGDWFTDNLTHDLGNKDAQQAMSGKWGLELSELTALVRSSPHAAKAFFSRQVDWFRPSYGRNFVERPRQCVFVATTNDGDYLTDPTGNRRYWPVFCEKAEVAWVAEVRDQLWAEAAALEAEGETLWLDDNRLETQASSKQAERVPVDVWTRAVLAWIRLEGKTQVHTGELLYRALALPSAQQNRSSEMRIASILKADGWQNHRHKVNGKTEVAWFAPGEELPGKGGQRVPEREEDQA